MKNKTIHIIGGTGKIGSWIYHFLQKLHYTVTISNSKDTHENADITNADVIFFAVPISFAPDIIMQIAKKVKKDTLLIDLSSIVTHAAKALEQTGNPALSLHLLFGPSVISMQNQKIVFIPIKDHPFIQELQELFVSEGAIITNMTPEEHDKQMAYIQALIHFTNLMLAQTLLRDEKTLSNLSTPVFLSQLAIMTRVLTNNSPKLLAEIQLENPYFKHIALAFVQAQTTLLDQIQQGDKETIERQFMTLRELVIPVEKREVHEEKHSEKQKSLQNPDLHVGYLGPEGTYSHQAAMAVFPSSNLHPFKTIYDIFNSVSEDKIDAGIVPAENSSEGTIRETLDYLADFELKVNSAVDLRIYHSLLSEETDLTKITKVIAHPQALAQCKGWLRKHIPQATTETATSNIAGVEEVKKNQHIAIIGSKTAAEKYDLHILAENIHDNPKNTTRFYVIAKEEDFSRAQNTLLFITVINRVGVLRDILNVFADFNINLNKLESRPSRGQNWDYHFFVEVNVAPYDPVLQQAMNILKRYSHSIAVMGGI